MRRQNIIVNKKALELDISPNSYKLFTILVLYSDSKGRCYPSIRIIEEKYHISHATILKCLKELEDNQVIMIFKRKKGTGKIDSNEYVISKEYLAPSIRKQEQLELFDYNWLDGEEDEKERI